MASTFSEMISYLKPLLSESDFNRLNFDLILRETNWNSQNDTLHHRIATLERSNLYMLKEREDYKDELIRCQNGRGELLLGNFDLEQKLSEFNSELGILRLKLAESKKEVQILNKQCLSWSKENSDLKEEIGKLGTREKELVQCKVELDSCNIVRRELRLSNIGLEQKVRDLKEEIGNFEAREKDTAIMYERVKQSLELEKGKTVELKKKKKDAEEKYEAVLLAGTKKYRVLEAEVAKIEEMLEKLLSGPQADSFININKRQQTNAQETIPCLQKASITSPLIVDITDTDSDSDSDEKIITPKRKPSSLEASENRSKQLKGTGKESVNASTSIASSQIGHENAVGDDDSDEFWACQADMLGAFEKDTELCMKAVCVLYLQHRPLNVFSSPREVALAKFLVDEDQMRLKRSVAELEKYDPNGSINCRKIAFNHSAQLFKIYKSKAYHFFTPNSESIFEMLLRS